MHLRPLLEEFGPETLYIWGLNNVDKIKEIDVADFIKDCTICLRFKKNKKKYRKLPPKEVTMISWESICIDLIVPCTFTDRLGNDRILNTMTSVDSVTVWFEITKIPDKTSARISQIFNNIYG